MKKIQLLLTAIILMLTLSACGNKKQQPTLSMVLFASLQQCSYGSAYQRRRVRLWRT